MLLFANYTAIFQTCEKFEICNRKKKSVKKFYMLNAKKKESMEMQEFFIFVLQIQITY